MKSDVINKFTIFLGIVVFIIVFLHFSIHGVRVLDMPTSIFYLDEKVTLAAFYSVVIAMLAGFMHLLTGISNSVSKTVKTNSLIMGFLLVALSIDEYFELHEYLNTIVKSLISGETAFGRAAQLSWLFPLFGFVFVIMLFFLKAIIQEKNTIIRYLYIAAMVSFAAAIPLELLGSNTYGQDIYLVFVGIEEGVEMAGVTFFLSASIRKFYVSQNLDFKTKTKKIKKTKSK